MIEKPPQIKRYFGVRLLSVLLKALAVMAVIVTVGAVGYVAVDFFGLPVAIRVNARNNGLYQIINLMLGLALTGGFIALAFYVMAQMLDLLTEINTNLRALARRENVQTVRDDGLSSANMQVMHEIRQLSAAVERQERLLRLQGRETPQ